MGLVLGVGIFLVIGFIFAIYIILKVDKLITWIYKKKGISPLSSDEW